MRSDPRRSRPWRPALAVGAAIAAAGATVPASAAANPETKRRPPTADAGLYLGEPRPTYSWHGCTATASRASLAAIQDPVPGAPPNTRGTKQGAVTFTATLGAPHLAWKAKKGWTICGVQASVKLGHPDVRSQLVAEIGYTSGARSGTTSPTGEETVAVRIPADAPDSAGVAPFRGKTLRIEQVRDVTVFVRRAGR